MSKLSPKVNRKSIAAFIGSAVPSVTLGLSTAAKWWAALVPVITTLVVWLSRENAPS